MEYPKTENLWARDPETHAMSPDNGIRVEEVGLVDSWLVLEKIDGMNMRVIWRPDEDVTPTIAGRTDRAQIPGDLLSYMKLAFTYPKLMSAFSWFKELEDGTTGHFRPKEVVLFGEGYGGGIQKGAHYRTDKSFMLFDVVIDGRWCRWSTVTEIAASLGIDTVPVLGTSLSRHSAQEIVRSMCDCTEDPEWRGQLWHGKWLSSQPEGVIARTDPYLYNHRGQRVMFKHKVRDVQPWLDGLWEDA